MYRCSNYIHNRYVPLPLLECRMENPVHNGSVVLTPPSVLRFSCKNSFDAVSRPDCVLQEALVSLGKVGRGNAGEAHSLSIPSTAVAKGRVRSGRLGERDERICCLARQSRTPARLDPCAQPDTGKVETPRHHAVLFEQFLTRQHCGRKVSHNATHGREGWRCCHLYLLPK